MFCFRIGLSTAERMAREGANVVISSRKLQNVKGAVKGLEQKGLTVSGQVCHVGNAEQRHNLIDEVCICMGRN